MLWHGNLRESGVRQGSDKPIHMASLPAFPGQPQCFPRAGTEGAIVNTWHLTGVKVLC